jgi:hypothetical protein
MKNTTNKQQKTIIWVSVAFVFAASALLNVPENQHKTSLGYGNQASSSNWQILGQRPQAMERNFQS